MFVSKIASDEFHDSKWIWTQDVKVYSQISEGIEPKTLQDLPEGWEMRREEWTRNLSCPPHGLLKLATLKTVANKSFLDSEKVSLEQRRAAPSHVFYGTRRNAF